jgi:hypothetical protein
VEKKKPNDYEKKYCHVRMHSKNYAIREVFKVENGFYSRLEAHDPKAMEEMEEKLREKGLEGEIILQRALGGLGRKGRWETRGAWLSKRKAGMPEVMRFTLE